MSDSTAMTSGTGQGARKAALRLSGIGEADRRWILGQLPGEQQSQIARALGELKQITGARELDFGLFLDEQARIAMDAQSSPGARSFNSLPYADASALLGQLPDHHLAIVLNSSLWHGSEQFLKECSAARRKSLATLQPVVAPSTTDAILAELARLTGSGED